MSRQYSEPIINALLHSVENCPKSARLLRLEAEKIRLGLCDDHIRRLELTLRIATGEIDHEKLRQHCLEAAHRIERNEGG